MSKMIEVIVDSVRVSLTNQQRIVVLRETDDERYLPIWIGPYEAESITIALQEVEVARPQTHDLLKNIVHALNARLVRVEVISLREDVFYGNLVIETNGRIIEVDSRPSDALALAVRAHVPILVAREIMESAGITPEAEASEQELSSASSASQESGISAPGQGQETSEERLSVFEDFLKNMKLDSDENAPSEDDPSEGDDDEPDEDPGDTPKKKKK